MYDWVSRRDDFSGNKRELAIRQNGCRHEYLAITNASTILVERKGDYTCVLEAGLVLSYMIIFGRVRSNFFRPYPKTIV